MFKRIELPYDYDGLEPHIDKLTIETHYEKHHKTYTEKFNALVDENPSLAGKSAEEILMNLDKVPEKIKKGLKNNGGGYYNHNLYFETFIPNGKKPSSALQKQIDADFGSLDKMIEALDKAATLDLFGSGYAWLVWDNGKITVTCLSNQDSPLQQGNKNILLPLDMWEHAYYLKYKNDKKEYVKQFFRIVNWDVVEKRLEKSK